MQTERGVERLVFFSDAVVAIAITLLALPLVDIWPGNPPRDASPLPVLLAHASQFLAFAISFAVIARYWLIHHRIFEHVERASRPLVVLNLLWLASIVVLPVWTALIAAYAPSSLSVALYSGTVAVSSVLLTGMSAVLARHPELSDPGHAQTSRGVLNGAVPTVLVAIGAVLGAAFPDVVNYFGLFLLALSRPTVLLAGRLLRLPPTGSAP